MMNKMKKSKLRWLIGILVVFLAIGGYYWNVQQSKKVLTIGIYTGNSWGVPEAKGYHLIDYAIKQFKKTHPGVTVKYEGGIRSSSYQSWLSDKLVQGKEPDVFIIPSESFNVLASTGTLKKLDDLADTSGYAMNKLYSGSIKAGQYNGHQYAMPYEQNPMVMVVNQSLLAKLGIKNPKFNITPSQFEKICRQVATKKGYYGVTNQYTWKDAVNSYDANIFGKKDQIDLTSTKARKAFSLMGEIQQLNGDANVTSALFDSGKVAFAPMTLAQYRTYTTYPYNVTRSFKFKWNVIRMPSINSKSGTSSETSMFAISSHTHNLSAAWDFLTVLISKKVQKELVKHSAGAPVLRSTVLSQFTQRQLDQEASNPTALTTKKLNKILRSTMVEPKFKRYARVMNDADYQLTRAISAGDIDTELFNIQASINEDFK